MNITVRLHTVLQRQHAPGMLGDIQLEISEQATVGDVLREMQIAASPETLILVINHRVASAQAILLPGDTLDIIPAISGGR